MTATVSEMVTANVMKLLEQTGDSGRIMPYGSTLQCDLDLHHLVFMGLIQFKQGIKGL